VLKYIDLVHLAVWPHTYIILLFGPCSVRLWHSLESLCISWWTKIDNYQDAVKVGQSKVLNPWKPTTKAIFL